MLYSKVTSLITLWGRLLFLPIVRYSRFRLNGIKSSLFIIVSSLVFSAPSVAEPDVHLTSDSAIATAGFFQLQWQSEKLTGHWQLQESKEPDLNEYKTIYTGADLARVMSGKSDGDYYYRVVLQDGAALHMSKVVKVTVAHHPLINAFIFFLIGAVVFIAILISIIKGNRQSTLPPR